MEVLTYKIPLFMYSNSEYDPRNKSMCLIRNMEDIDVSQVHGIEKLGGQCSWISNYTEYYSNPIEVEKMFARDKKYHGFNYKEVVMDVVFNDGGYYVAEFLSILPLDTMVTRDNYYDRSEAITLKEAIKDFLDGQLSDGVGENEIGIVSYNNTTHDVWLGDAIEI